MAHSQLTQMATRLRAQFPRTLKQVIFFGSQVRRDATPESDWDCLLVS